MAVGRARRWVWQRPLRAVVVHALLVAAAVGVAVVPAAAGWTALAEAAVQPLLLLGAPVLLVAVYSYPRPGLGPVAGALLTAVPAALVLVAHLSVVLAVRRSSARAAAAGASRPVELFVVDAPALRMAPRTAVTAAASATVGVAAWVVWLSGWLPLSWPPLSWPLLSWLPASVRAAGSSAGLVDGAHTVVQHWGWSATLVAAAMVLALRWQPFVVAAGLTLGSWGCWTVWVLGQGSAFGVFASAVVLATTGPLTVVFALLGYSARPLRRMPRSPAAPV